MNYRSILKSAFLSLTLAGTAPAIAQAQHHHETMKPKASTPKQTKKVDLNGLRDQNGSTVEMKNYAGRNLLVFAGFTQCPDICPMTRSNVIRALAQIQRERGREFAQSIMPLMITIDPANDTPAALRRYFSGSGITGVTGTQQQLSTALESMGVAVDMNTRNHDGLIRLAEPGGRVVLELPGALPPERLAQKLAEKISELRQAAPAHHSASGHHTPEI